MKDEPIKNNHVLLCWVGIHWALVAATIALFIWSSLLDSETGFRWNLTIYVPFMAWLSGIITFLIGIRKKKGRLLSHYLRFNFIFWLVCTPIIILGFLFRQSYYAESTHYVVHNRTGLLSNPNLRLSRKHGVLKREVYVLDDCSLDLRFERYNTTLKEYPDLGVVVFTAMNGKWRGYTNIVTTDTLQYMTHKKEVSDLIDSSFKSIRQRKDYCFVGLNPENG